MYIIKQMVLKNNTWQLRRFNNKVFDTYEQARSYVRKWIRKNSASAMFLYANSNAAISDFNFSVVRK